jgi:hypothetical protein
MDKSLRAIEIPNTVVEIGSVGEYLEYLQLRRQSGFATTEQVYSEHLPYHGTNKNSYDQHSNTSMISNNYHILTFTEYMDKCREANEGSKKKTEDIYVYFEDGKPYISGSLEDGQNAFISKKNIGKLINLLKVRGVNPDPDDNLVQESVSSNGVKVNNSDLIEKAFDLGLEVGKSVKLPQEVYVKILEWIIERDNEFCISDLLKFLQSLR